MSAIDTALRLIKSDISPSLLQLAFMARRYDPIRLDRQYDRITPVNLDQVIRDKVIYGRVLLDMNLVSGTEVEIPLRDGEFTRVDTYNAIYRFDNKVLAGRTIIHPLEVSYGYLHNTVIGVPAGVVSYAHHSSQLMKAAKDVLASPAPTSTTYLEMVGHNTLMVTDTTPLSVNGILRAIVCNDPDLRNWQPAYWMKIAKLMLAATKAYIYTQLNTETDIAQLYAGVALSKITQEIENMADQNQIYLDQLETFRKMGLMNDRTTRRKVIRMALSNRPKY